MPELPEVEHLKRTLEPHLLGVQVADVQLRRRDFARSPRGTCPRKADLLTGQTIVALHRHGKQMAIEGDAGSVICVHLGMSGQIFHLRARKPLPSPSHVHCVWRTRACGKLVFRDPRRFGGIWTFRSMGELSTHRWSLLGPDALSITAKRLHEHSAGSQRPIKAVLLDQSVLAGVGNIYADESLFGAGLHPCQPADSIPAKNLTRLAASIRSVLKAAIRSGGSTLRDYRDGDGQPGVFRHSHCVYGRAGLPCVRCTSVLRRVLVAQRTTTYCHVCQRLSESRDN